MGSYNVMCGISGLSISPGDRALIVPLEPHDLRYLSYLDSNTTELLLKGTVLVGAQPYIVSNEGAAAYWTPSALPIVGEYDDYGRFSLVKSPLNWHVPYLEKSVGVSAQSILSDLHEGAKNNWSFMFILESVYDAIMSFSRSESAYQWQSITSKLLEVMGFNKIGATSDSRYNQLWEFPERNLFIACDGGFGYVANVLGKSVDENVDENGNELDTWDVEKVEDIECGFNGISKFVGKKNLAKVYQHSTIYYDLWKSYSCYIQQSRCWEDDLFKAENQAFWMRPYKHCEGADNEQIFSSLSDLLCTAIYMYNVGRIWMPTQTGPQGGEPEYNLHLANITAKIAQDAISMRKKYNEDDDED